MAPSENSTAGDVVVLVVPCWSPSASLDERLGVLGRPFGPDADEDDAADEPAVIHAAMERSEEQK